MSTGVISCSEESTQVSSTELDTLDIPLIDMAELNKVRLANKKKNLKYIHYGMIQIGLVPLFDKGIDSPTFVAVIDKRFKKFKDQLIGGMQTNLHNGPAWFKVHPNFCMALDDPLLSRALCLRIKTLGMDKMIESGKHLAIHKRVIYRLINTTNPHVKEVSKVSSVFELTNPEIQTFSRKDIVPTQLTWPTSWVIDRKSVV